MLARSCVALALAIMVQTPSAWAVTFKHSEPTFVPVHNCTCRFDGQNVALGQRRCLKTAEGPRTAECVMEQNVTSWRPSKEPCPEARLFSPRA